MSGGSVDSDEAVDVSGSSPEDLQRLLRLMGGFRITQMLYVAARLSLADLLANGPKTTDELALETGANAGALYRVMRGLASLGVFEEIAERRFALTPLAALLQHDHPYSMRGQAFLFGEESYRAWGELLYSVMTGKTAFDHLFGVGHFAYLAQDPAASVMFNQAMSASSRRSIATLVNAYDFSTAETVMDVGGGHGMLLSAVLRANPGLRGILFDEAHVVAGAAPTLEAAGVADRCERVAGDFFTALPPGADIYMMRHIIHDWDDERSVTILRNCAQALAPGGRLLVIENIIAPGNEPSHAKLLDLQMMVMNGGRERTTEEYRRLFAAAGLTLTRIIPAGAESLIEGGRSGGLAGVTG